MIISTNKTIFFTCIALIAFAGNSVLCRLALGDSAIDAASFTTVRLLSGILVLGLIMLFSKSNSTSVSKGSWSGAVALFLYAVTFSYAYISLATGVGALILFGTVQITMILASLFTGNKLHYSEWLGVIIAFAGFVYLVIPDLDTPSLQGFILMSLAGIAWAGYTLIGRGSDNPLSDTSYNFLRTLPLIVVLSAITFQDINLSNRGIILAALSGGITSGLGYTAWYVALGGLKAIQAAVVQLFVPVIAAIGGVLFANELISMRLILSSAMILGGIFFVIMGHYYFVHQSSK